MFKEELELIQSIFDNYFADGKYFIIFLIAVVFIIVEEKNKNTKNLLVYYTGVVLLIVVNPIFCGLILKFVGENVYYRFLWLLPLGFVIAYFSTILISKLDNRLSKAMISIFLLAIIMYAGKVVYSQDTFEKVNNLYKIPDEYVQVVDIIKKIPLENKKAMVSTELVGYIRQLDASIKLTYGRRPYGDYNYEKNLPLRHYTYGSTPYLTKVCKEQNTNIIVYDKTIPLVSPLSEYGFELYDQTENYDIYFLNE